MRKHGTSCIIRSGADGPRLLVAAVLQRAVLDARGFPYGEYRGTNEVQATFERRMAWIQEDAKAFLENDAYRWCEFMENPPLWHEMLDEVEVA